MKPANLKTKIFLDGGDPNETKEAIKILGFLDGQTTNPTLIAKNPQASLKLQKAEKFSEKEVMDFYKKVAQEISSLLPEGSVSIEVPADKDTAAAQMLNLAKQMSAWIPNAYIKLPITTDGLEAASKAVKMGMRVNMTLCFTQEQAAAVYAATKGGSAYVSPFVGRLDDKGQNGMDLVKNIVKMYEAGDHHVQTLAASIRNIGHFLAALYIGADIITAPLPVLREWAEKKMPAPEKNYSYSSSFTPIPYKEVNLSEDWLKFNIYHELTDAGLEKFASDWQSLIAQSPL